MEQLSNSFYESPIGTLELWANDINLLSIKFIKNDLDRLPENTNTLLRKVARQLDEYFEKERKFFDLPLSPSGTEFQRNVWEALCSVTYGQTASYKDVAKKIGNYKAVRAVGGANGKNPIPIIIPCHRIIGSNECLVGYAGGLWRKEWLLRHEGALLI